MEVSDGTVDTDTAAAHLVVDLRAQEGVGRVVAGGGRLGRSAAERGVFGPLHGVDDDDPHRKYATSRRGPLGKAWHAVWQAVGGAGSGADRLLHTLRHEADAEPRTLGAEADQAVMLGQQQRTLNGTTRHQRRDSADSLSTGSGGGGGRSLRDLEAGGGALTSSDSDDAAATLPPRVVLPDATRRHLRTAVLGSRSHSDSDSDSQSYFSGSDSDSDSGSGSDSDSDSGSGSGSGSDDDDDDDDVRHRRRRERREQRRVERATQRDLCELILRRVPPPPDLAQARYELERFRGRAEWRALRRAQRRVDTLFRDSVSLTGQPDRQDLDALTVELRAYCRERDHLRVPTLKLLEPLVCAPHFGAAALEVDTAVSSSSSSSPDGVRRGPAPRNVSVSLDVAYQARVAPHTACVRLSLLDVLQRPRDTAAAAEFERLMRDCGGERRFVVLDATLGQVASNCAASLHVRLVDTEQPHAFCVDSDGGAAVRPVWVTCAQRLRPDELERRTELPVVATPTTTVVEDAERARERERQLLERRRRLQLERQWREKRTYRPALWRAPDPSRAKLCGLVFGGRSTAWFDELLRRGVEPHHTDFSVDDVAGRLHVPAAVRESARRWEQDTFRVPPPGSGAVAPRDEVRVPVTIESVLLLHPDTPQDYDWFVVDARRWRQQRAPAVPLHRLRDLAVEVCRVDRQPFCGRARAAWHQRSRPRYRVTVDDDDDDDSTPTPAPAPLSDLLPASGTTVSTTDDVADVADDDEPPLEVYAKVTLSVYMVQARSHCPGGVVM